MSELTIYIQKNNNSNSDNSVIYVLKGLNWYLVIISLVIL